MNFTFHQLQVFVKVCETSSITRAAEELHLTQPAVSIQLKKFQEQFDIPLTEIIGRKLFITEFGLEIEKVCHKILEESKTIENKAQLFKGLLAGKLSFSVVSTGKYVLPYFLSGFNKKYPEIDITIDVTNKEKVIHSLSNNNTEFALVSTLPEEMSFTSVELFQNQLFLVGGKNANHADRISREELTKLPFIFREGGSATRKAMEEYLLSQGINPNARLELVSNEAVKQAVCAGLGYSIIPLIGMKGELDTGRIKIIEASNLPIRTMWRLIYNPDKQLSPVGQAFLDYVKENKGQITSKYFFEAH